MKQPRKYRDSVIIDGIALGFSVAFLLAAFITSLYSGEIGKVFYNWGVIQITPCPLVTDYFALGGVASTMLNAGICGMVMWLFMVLMKGDSHPNTMAGYFLVVAHCFYGLNLVNMMPCFLASMLYLRFNRLNLNDNLHICMFSTSFGPFISELLFRYTQGDAFTFGEVHLTVSGVVLTVIFVVMLAFLLPALLPGAKAWHKGYNLYNGGLAFGIFGFFLYNFLYKTMGKAAPTVLQFNNPLYEQYGRSYRLYANVFFLSVFAVCLFSGFLLNGKSFHGIQHLYRDTGYISNFAEKYGMPLCLINIGFYGTFFLAYINLAILLTDGAGFTGPTVGVVLAALTFSCMGQHVRNVWPIIAGYQVLYLFTLLVCSVTGNEITWSVSTQAYINGVAFATGLCPIVGRYGIRAGIASGFLCACMCTATRDLHGGLVLYNGGLTAGLTALIMLPILEHYFPEAAREQIHGMHDFIMLVTNNRKDTTKHRH